MRYLVMILALSISSMAIAAGSKPSKVSKIKSLKDGEGVVAISVRSEIFLPDRLEVYFLKEGGSIDNKKDVFRFSRRQSFLAVGNDTTDYAVKTFRLPAGKYRLVGHGVNCPSVPKPGYRCSVTVTVNGIGGSPISRPSKGYSGETPSFVVEPQKLTLAGDFLLANTNTILWSEIPESELSGVGSKFGELQRTQEPSVPESFVLSRPVRGRGMFDNMGRRY